MATRLIRPIGRTLAPFLLATIVAIQAALSFAGGAAAATPPFRLDVASRGDFVAQTNFVQCVGASMQMMLNMIRTSDDRTAATQLTLQDLARRLSPSRTDNIQRKGASVVGWAAGLSAAGGGPYRLAGLDSIDEAMHVAADAIRETGRPVGLLVWHGRHAWVMSGFESTADPLAPGDFRVTRAIVLDPLYPYGSSVWGPSPQPRQALSIAALGKQFVPRRAFRVVGTGSTTATGLGMVGKYVLVLPYEPIAVHGLRIS